VAAVVDYQITVVEIAEQAIICSRRLLVFVKVDGHQQKTIPVDLRTMI
jgi:hypothetical protein